MLSLGWSQNLPYPIRFIAIGIKGEVFLQMRHCLSATVKADIRQRKIKMSIRQIGREPCGGFKSLGGVGVAAQVVIVSRK